jgi:hypothetical protein
MGSTGFTLQEATSVDLDDMTDVMLRAMSWDPIVKTLNQYLTPAEAHAVGRSMLQWRMTLGLELGAYRAWKVVDENGCTSFVSILALSSSNFF